MKRALALVLIVVSLEAWPPWEMDDIDVVVAGDELYYQKGGFFMDMPGADTEYQLYLEVLLDALKDGTIDVDNLEYEEEYGNQ